MRLCKHGKSALAFTKQFSKVRTNLNRHNRVYILSSKHSYRPMRARVAAQLFYKKISNGASEISHPNIFVSLLGAEPMTCQATVHCSTTELQHIHGE